MQKLFITVILLISNVSIAEKEVINFNSIKKILKNDNLESTVSKKEAIKRKRRKANLKNIVKRYDVPTEAKFWTFMSEYWLVKNAQILKWDVEKPDYALNDSFKTFLEKMGHYEKKFKILLLNTSGVTHFALPANVNEYIFVLSIPFIRILDLSKLEISILLFEDFLRAENRYFQSKVSSKELKALLGGNFYKKKLNKEIFNNLFKAYDNLVFDKGFNFKQQFQVTRQMDQIFKSDMKIWNLYLGLIKKIDLLTKTNIIYSNYVKIYPSPELQLGWLSPIKKGI